MFHLRFGLSDHLKALRDFVFGSRRRVKKVRIAKDCQYPRDPMQPAIKKKKKSEKGPHLSSVVFTW